jgi:peroxiredoxin
MQALGTAPPDFSLPDTEGNTVSLADFADKEVLLIMFICNHCPYVKHVAPELAMLARDFEDKGVGFVAINSNDIETHPDDGPEKMKEEVAARDYTFPYLYDETQAVAKAYGAACTPDFFLYDRDRKLVYRGQLDESRPGNGKRLTGEDIRSAIDCVLQGRPVTKNQTPSVGCNIKWKPGNEPEYFGG